VEDYRRDGHAAWRLPFIATPPLSGWDRQRRIPNLANALPVQEAAERIENFLHAMTLELQIMARACG